MWCRDQISRFQLEQSDQLQNLDSTTKSIINTIVKQEGLFRAAHDTQGSLIRTLQGETIAVIEDESRKIIQEFRVWHLSCLFNSVFDCL
jgi:hypothetical protein